MSTPCTTKILHVVILSSTYTSTKTQIIFNELRSFFHNEQHQLRALVIFVQFVFVNDEITNGPVLGTPCVTAGRFTLMMCFCVSSSSLSSSSSGGGFLTKHVHRQTELRIEIKIICWTSSSMCYCVCFYSNTDILWLL